MSKLVASANLPLSPSTINNGLRELNRYAYFVESSVDAFGQERALRRQGLTFIYLIDFQEIYDYVAPFVLHPREDRRTFLHRFSAARDLFDNSTEPIFFPLGTLLEISSFVRHLRDRIHSLHRITIAQDLDRGVEQLVRFFEAEHFLDQAATQEYLDGAGSPAARLASVQERALALLSDFEVGASRLHALLTRPNVFDLPSLLQQYPIHLRRAPYERVLGALAAVRQKKDANKSLSTSSLNNIADAFNTCLATTLNDRFDVASDRPKQPWHFFKLITDTRSLFTLRHELEAQLTYRNYHGFNMPLFERRDEVIYKRILHLLADCERKNEIEKLATSARRAKNAHLRLGLLAEPLGLSPDEILRSLLEPRATTDLGLVKESSGIVADLRGFVLDERAIVGNVLRARAREEVAATPALISASADRPYSAQSVLAVQSLLDSIDTVVNKTIQIDFDLTPEQRSYSSGVWNPLLTLESLGYEKLLKEERDRQSTLLATWVLKEKASSAAVLMLEIHSDHISVSWPTAGNLITAINVLVEAQYLLDPEELQPTSLILVDYHGCDTILSPAHLEMVEKYAPEEVAFVRVDWRRLAFVAELFSADSNYSLASGSIHALPLDADDFTFTLRIFKALTQTALPEKLLRRAIMDALTTYSTAWRHTRGRR